MDPAWELKKILTQLESYNVELVAVYLTHSHWDHVNLVDSLVILHRPKVYMSLKEIEFYNYSCENLTPITDGDRLYIGKCEVQVILTPGHTAGSVCFKAGEYLFTGDTVFVEGCGICNGFGGSAIDMYKSLQKLKALIQPQTNICPGHSFSKKIGCSFQYLLDNNIYFLINDIRHFLSFRMRKNQPSSKFY